MDVAVARVGERQIGHTDFESIRAADAIDRAEHQVLSNHIVGRRVAVPVVDRAPCIEDDPTARVGEQLHRDGVGLGELHRAQSRVDRVERYCRSVDIARITKRTGVTADAGRRSQVDVIADEVLIPRAFRCRVVGDRSDVVRQREIVVIG